MQPLDFWEEHKKQFNGEIMFFFKKLYMQKEQQINLNLNFIPYTKSEHKENHRCKLKI